MDFCKVTPCSFQVSTSNYSTNEISKTPNLDHGRSNTEKPYLDSHELQSTPQGSSHTAGEVVLTPSYSAFTPQLGNPHSTLTAHTPMASGPSQAKNSIKIQ